MDSQTNQTTATAATAGAAFGGLVGWGIAAATGVDTAPISTPLAVCGAFFFGIIFPGR
jgi:hypothetical protein